MSLQTRLQDLVTAVATDYKQVRVWLTGSSTGDLTGLATTNKTSVIAAINEVNSKSPAAATTSSAGTVELATDAETVAGTSSTLATTPTGVAAALAALVDAAPGTLDTLNELAAALGDDPNFAATMTTGLANRVRTDTDAQGLTETQKQNARTNIDVYSVAQLGNPETDLVAAYTTAKA